MMERDKLIEGVPQDDYRTAPGVSKSTLDRVAQSPALVEWDRRAPRDPEADSQVDIGHAFETALLEPERYMREYITAPSAPRNTKEGKAQHAEVEQQAADEGRTIVTANVAHQIEYMVESALAHPMVARILGSNYMTQPSLWWRDKQTGLDCKCRPDIALADVPMLADVKITGQPERFANAVHDLRYDVQDAYYSEGCRRHYGQWPAFLFIVVSSTRAMGKYPVNVYELSPEDKEVGRRRWRRDLDTYAGCLEHQGWTHVQQITRPAWAWRTIENEAE